eukprot:EC692150.1.p2 GENE.EC692150.1~~EC692150.1.p2  ORF type:complete len:89 (+),score=24.98 EC692150.1:407-673(+)
MCNLGDRSSAFLAAYLIARCGYSLDGACKLLEERGLVLDGWDNMCRQKLQELEEQQQCASEQAPRESEVSEGPNITPSASDPISNSSS